MDSGSVVAYHLQKISGKSSWKVNGTRLFGSSQRKISRSNGTSEKVVLFFRMDYSKRKFVFHFFKALQSHLWYQFQAFTAVFRWMELISTNGKRDSGTKFTSPEPGADLVWDDLPFSNSTGILQKKKKKNYVVYWCWSRARDEATPS